MQVRLIIANGKQAGREIPIAGPKFLIGRGEGCQLRPQISEVSRKHCMILVENGGVAVEDCGSTNGTFLNDERLTERKPLRDGDHIRIGLLMLEARVAADIGGAKKPVVHTVQEAAARTVAASSAAKASDDLDISSWLGEEGTVDLSPTREQKPKSGDTLAGASLIETAAVSIPSLKTPLGKKKDDEKKDDKKKASGSPSKIAGKRQQPVKPTAADSGAAAEDALRQFFHRKR